MADRDELATILVGVRVSTKDAAWIDAQVELAKTKAPTRTYRPGGRPNRKATRSSVVQGLVEAARLADEAKAPCPAPPSKSGSASRSRSGGTPRKGASGALPRGQCPRCHVQVALRKGGLVREHQGDSGKVCAGSGEPSR